MSVRAHRALRDALAREVGALSAQVGKCYATTEGLRQALARRTGVLWNERTVRRVLKRLRVEGLMGHERVLPGGRLASGRRTCCGGQHNWLVSRLERRKRAKRLARERKIQSALEAKRLREANEERDRQEAARAKLQAEREAEERLRAEAATPEQAAAFLASLDALFRKPPD